MIQYIYYLKSSCFLPRNSNDAIEVSVGEFLSANFCVVHSLCVGNKIILTNSFIKKTNKTSVTELNLAKKYKLDYEQRMVQNE